MNYAIILDPVQFKAKDRHEFHRARESFSWTRFDLTCAELKINPRSINTRVEVEAALILLQNELPGLIFQVVKANKGVAQHKLF